MHFFKDRSFIIAVKLLKPSYFLISLFDAIHKQKNVLFLVEKLTFNVLSLRDYALIIYYSFSFATDCITVYFKPYSL